LALLLLIEIAELLMLLELLEIIGVVHASSLFGKESDHWTRPEAGLGVVKDG